jgi:hypothetical protein
MADPDPNTPLPAGQVAVVVSAVPWKGPPDGTTVAEWVAKSRQESSHRPGVVNVGAGKRHVGLWQIQETHAGKAGSPTDRDLFVQWLKNPHNNWEVARVLYEEAGGWRPWAASGGKPTPTEADTKAAEEGSVTWSNPLDTFTQPFETLEDAASALVQYVQSAYEWFSKRENVTRVAIGGIGFLVVVGAIGALAKPTVQGVIPG